MTMKTFDFKNYSEKLKINSISLSDLDKIDNTYSCLNFFEDIDNCIDFSYSYEQTLKDNPNMSKAQRDNFEKLYYLVDYDELDDVYRNCLYTILGNILLTSDEVDRVLGDFGYEYCKHNDHIASDNEIKELIYDEISPLVCIPLKNQKIYAHNEHSIKIENYDKNTGTFVSQRVVNINNDKYKNAYSDIIHDILNDIHFKPWKQK